MPSSRPAHLGRRKLGALRGEPQLDWGVSNAAGGLEQSGFMDEKRRSTRGFASMDPERQRAIARKGGESVPNEKRSFSQNPSLAAEAGRKGGQSVNPEKRSFSQNHNLASEAGRKGGHASHGSRKAGG